MPTDVRSLAIKLAANQGALDSALQDEYMATLRDRVHDPARLKATWGASFLILKQKDKLAAILQTAMSLLGCEHGAITMIGEDAVVLVGVNAPVIKYDINESYCQHVMDEQPFQVDEATRNNLVCKVRGTTDIGVRSYLGVPVTFQDYVVGSMCVYDLKEREWRPADVRVLASLALTVQQVIG